MSVNGMMQTVLVTELKALQPNISNESIRYILDSLVEFQADSGRKGYLACAKDVGYSGWSELEFIENADEYAEEIRRGEL